jgi:hypothetical protein
MGLPVPPVNQNSNRPRAGGVTMASNDEAGAVTAETAVALPLIALFAVSMAWLVSLGITQVRALDAARETARAAARSDGAGQAVSLGRRVAPAGSRISVRRDGQAVVASVSSPVRGPAGLFGGWSSFRVRAEAVAAEEPAP